MLIAIRIIGTIIFGLMSLTSLGICIVLGRNYFQNLPASMWGNFVKKTCLSTSSEKLTFKAFLGSLIYWFISIFFIYVYFAVYHNIFIAIFLALLIVLDIIFMCMYKKGAKVIEDTRKDPDSKVKSQKILALTFINMFRVLVPFAIFTVGCLI